MELSIGAGIVHGAILLGLVAAWQVPRVRLRFAEITGLRPEEVRKVSRKQAEQEIHKAAELAIAGFDGLARIEGTGSSRDAVALRITWTSGGYNRMVLVVAGINRQLRIELYGGVRALDGTEDGGEQRIKSLRGLPEPERIAPYIVRALKQVDHWQLTNSDGSPRDQA